MNTRARRITLYLIVCLTLCLVTSSPASAETRFYGDGTLGFSYICTLLQFPFTTYQSGFNSNGGLPRLEDFPPTAASDQATVAYSYDDPQSGQMNLVIAGCVVNNDANQTFDLTVLVVSQSGAIEAGDHTAALVYLDNAEGEVVLADLVEAINSVDDPEDIVLSQITADYQYGGVANLNLTEVTASIAGSFTGAAGNGDYGMLISDGSIAVDFSTVPTAEISLGSTKVMYR